MIVCMPRFESQLQIKLGAVVWACNPRMWEVEAGGSRVQGQPPLTRELGYLRPCLKTEIYV